MNCADHHETCEMILTGDHNGVQEWECPTCGKVQEVEPRTSSYGKTEIRIKRRSRHAIRELYRDNSETPIVQCANGHSTVNMVCVNYDVVGTWYQCPQCFSRRVVTGTGIIDEAAAHAKAADIEARAARQAADQAREAAEKRAAKERERQREAEEAQLGAAEASRRNRERGQRAQKVSLYAALSTVGVAVVGIAWPALSRSGGPAFFIGAAAFAGAAIAQFKFALLPYIEFKYSRIPREVRSARLASIRMSTVAAAALATFVFGVQFVYAILIEPVLTSLSFLAIAIYFGVLTKGMAEGW